MISARDYYSEFHGHLTSHLEPVHTALRGSRNRPLLFLAGDSSLDNKYWLQKTAPPIGGYEGALNGAMVKDVAYYLTKESISRHGDEGAQPCINTSVEATTLSQRNCGHLLPQDKFIGDNIQPSDTLLVSIGGNDIALAPTPCTILNMLGLIYCTPSICIEHGFGYPIPITDPCLGCGPACLSTLTSFPPFGGYFLHLFNVQVKNYVQRLISKNKPKRVAICMIYYPDVSPRQPSWADAALGFLGYNRNPAKLQLMIRKMYELAVSEIKIPGVEVVPIPLFEVMDGGDTRDYVARVEPSEEGGRKMAEFIIDRIEGGRKMDRE